MDDDHEVSALFGSGEAMLREALSAKRDECLRLRARLSEAEARCAEVERERDEMRGKVAHECGWCGYEQVGPDGMREHAMTCAKSPLVRALAASQAREARLREALEELGEHGSDCPWAYFSAGRPKDGGGYEMLYRETWYEVRPDDKRPACTCGLNAALASAPGSTDALRAMLKEAATEGINEGYGNGLSYGTERIEAIVSRILGERSDDSPQGRGERGKEGGDA